MAAAQDNRWSEPHDRDAGREPCPDRIVEDLGGAFGMGCIGGFIWHFVKVGYWKSRLQGWQVSQEKPSQNENQIDDLIFVLRRFIKSY